MSELQLKRWRRFLSRRAALAAALFLLGMGVISATAEIWANSKPLYLFYSGRTYFPVFQEIHPSTFGIKDAVQMDYHRLELKAGDRALWPAIHWDPLQRNEALKEYPSPPSDQNSLGTDENGRDVASRLLYGFRYSFIYALSVWTLASLIGIFLGGFMGFLGGWFDIIGQRLIEIWESVPVLMLLIVLSSVLRPNIYVLALCTGVFSWINVSLYTRGEFLKLRRREFIEAAQAIGASRWAIVFRHLLPNGLTPWITISPFLIASSITGLAALDFLGFGLPAPTPSWGELLGQAQKHFQSAWWLAVFPSLALFLTLTSLNLIGSAIRDAFDPRK